ncbi:hypothetical protein EGP64_01185 [bacterium]|nr:hypothetical protein [bacterium]
MLFLKEIYKIDKKLFQKEKDEQMIKNTQLYRATQEGINIGINQGMKKEKLEIAKTLLNKHMSIEDIIDITGLTKEEIESYKII